MLGAKPAVQRARQFLPDPEVFKGDIASYQNFKHLLKAKLCDGSAQCLY